MTSNPAMRASDVERERVVELLKEQTAQGRLTLEELEERTGAAYAASTRAELERLLEDLPQESAAAGARRAPTRTRRWRVVLACCCGLGGSWER
jgi:hypothetical protein